MTTELTIQDLIGNVELESLWVFEQRARRRDVQLEGVDPADDPAAATNFNLQVMNGQSDNEVVVRIRATVTHPLIEVIADVSSIFRKGESVIYSDDLVNEFTGSVGILAIYPQVRSVVLDLSTRAGVPVLMGLMRSEMLTPDGWQEVAE